MSVFPARNLDYQTSPGISAESAYSPWLHALAMLTACAIFPLIFMGGLVTSKGAGMSVPDWPNSYGYNMLLFPPNRWVGPILYEHTHRLMGTLVGMLAIATTIVAWRVEARGWVKWLATGVLLAVCVQGVIGGLRVTENNENLAMIHGIFAQAVFCVAAGLSVVTSRWWHHSSQDRASNPACRCIGSSGALVVGIIFLQLIFGSLMRHDNAGLAIPDFPLSYGHVLPPVNQSQLQPINAERVAGQFGNAPQLLIPMSLTQIWLHFAHRAWAVIVTLGVLILCWQTLSRFGGELMRKSRASKLAIPALWLLLLLVAQLTLGILTVLLRKPADIASWHVGVGALTLMTTFVLTLRARRLSRQ